jgi:hypothetical protein
VLNRNPPDTLRTPKQEQRQANKPMVPTAPTGLDEYPTSSMRRHIGQPLGRTRLGRWNEPYGYALRWNGDDELKTAPVAGHGFIPQATA